MLKYRECETWSMECECVKSRMIVRLTKKHIVPDQYRLQECIPYMNTTTQENWFKIFEILRKNKINFLFISLGKTFKITTVELCIQ